MVAQLTTSTEERQGLLRLDFEGDWTVSELMEFMQHVDLAVRALWAILHPEFKPLFTLTVLLRPSTEEFHVRMVVAEAYEGGAISVRGPGLGGRVLSVTVDRSNAEAVRSRLERRNSVLSIESGAGSWLIELERGAGSLAEAPAEALRAAVEAWLTKEARPIGLRSLHFGSPGWIEVIQSLNPLKAIENLISAWRHENTLRAKQANTAEASRREHQSKREQTRMAFQLELLKEMSQQLREDVYAPLLLEVSLRSTEALAEDPRLKDVQVKELEE